MTSTEADFDRLFWHDCHIRAVEFRVGDPDQGEWTSDLVLDIDFILERISDGQGGGRFRVAPATLVFHGVTDPKVDIDWGDSGFQQALHTVSIDRIEREEIRNQKVYLDRPYYKWKIHLNWPDGGGISFGAVGFSQTLSAEPVLTENDHLSLAERNRLIGGTS